MFGTAPHICIFGYMDKPSEMPREVSNRTLSDAMIDSNWETGANVGIIQCYDANGSLYDKAS